MAWSRIGLARIPHDGCLAPVDVLMAQRCSTGQLVMHHARLAAGPPPGSVPLTPQLERLVTWHQERFGGSHGPPGSRCAPPDIAPFHFFASRCAPRGNGEVAAMELPFGLHAPMVFHLGWRVSATLPCPAPELQLYYEEARTGELGVGKLRHYPGTAWAAIPPERLALVRAHRSACRSYLHAKLEFRPGPVQGAPWVPKRQDPAPRPTLLHLPVEEIVKDHYAKRGGRSVLTFEKKKGWGLPSLVWFIFQLTGLGDGLLWEGVLVWG